MAYDATRDAAAAQPEWLTLGQAAKYLGVAQSTMRKWSDLGRVSAFYTPGGHRRYRRADLDQFLDRSGPGGAPPVSRAGPLVLIVDDDEALRAYVRVNLEAEGYEVREAGSAEEGLEALGERSPDLILLDVMMPQVDGWETLRRIQEHTGVGAIPVIMFSGKVDEESASEAASRGVQGFIGKPFDPRSLIESTKQQLPVLTGVRWAGSTASSGTGSSTTVSACSIRSSKRSRTQARSASSGSRLRSPSQAFRGIGPGCGPGSARRS